MRRREFIALVGGAAAWPLTTHAQQSPSVHRIAVVDPSASMSELNEAGGSGYRALFQGLRRLGYVEVRNLVVERYSAGKIAMLSLPVTWSPRIRISSLQSKTP